MPTRLIWLVAFAHYTGWNTDAVVRHSIHCIRRSLELACLVTPLPYVHASASLPKLATALPCAAVWLCSNDCFLNKADVRDHFAETPPHPPKKRKKQGAQNFAPRRAWDGDATDPKWGVMIFFFFPSCRSALVSPCFHSSAPSSSRWRKALSTPSQGRRATLSARTSSSGSRSTTRHWWVSNREGGGGSVKWEAGTWTMREVVLPATSSSSRWRIVMADKKHISYLWPLTLHRITGWLVLSCSLHLIDRQVCR